MMQLPDEQKQVVRELTSDLEASLAEVKDAVEQNSEAVVQRLQHLQAKASDGIAFINNFEAETKGG